MKIFLWILTGVLLNTCAQLLLKVCMNRMAGSVFGWEQAYSYVCELLLNPYFIAGMSCYVISVGVWLLVLSRVEVSYAYPLLSMGYVINAFIAYYWLHESMSMNKIMGIVLIMLGVICMMRGT